MASNVVHLPRPRRGRPTREIEMLSGTPQTMRAARYLEERVRRVSDDVAAIAAATGFDEDLQKSLSRKQGEISRFRQAVAHLAESSPSKTIALAPLRRAASGEQRP